MVDEDGTFDHVAYEVVMEDFIKINYAMLLATFLENNDELFREHIEEMYDDHKGQPMKWKWDI